MNALIIGEWNTAIKSLPNLLSRARFDVDVVLSKNLLMETKVVRELIYAVDKAHLLEILRTKLGENYSLIVIADDFTLHTLLNSDFSDEEKLKLLPVVSASDFCHLCSKINLAYRLQSAGINAPEFRVAMDESQVMALSAELGYPVLAKIDFSCAGAGVFEFTRPEDITAALKTKLRYPLLIQKKIRGIETDLSGFFYQGKLVHFSCSTVHNTLGKFGLSSLKVYSQLGILEKAIFDELQTLGNALGIDGFANISCIQSEENGQRYYFEADLRANIWINYPKFFGDDPAVAIANFLQNQQSISYPYVINSKFPLKMLMPNPKRLRLRDIMVNRYKVWKFMDRYDFFYFNKRLLDAVKQQFHKHLHDISVR